MEPTDTHDALRGLRLRAELQRPAPLANLPASTSAEMKRLVQELQIHQVELEMQNEELLHAQVQAELSRAQYADLYDSAPVGYCTLDRSGTLRQVNNYTCRLLGEPRGQLLYRRLALFVEFDERQRFSDFLVQLWAVPGQHHSCEIRMSQKSAAPKYVQVEGVAVPANLEQEQPAGCRLVLLDVSARRAATDAIAANEARFRAAFEQSYDGMVLLDGDFRFVDANNAALRLLGLTDRAQLLGRSLAECWPATQPGGQATPQVLADCLQEAKVRGWCRQELQRHGPDGEPVWDELSFNPMVLQGQPVLHAAWRDITARKRTEQLLRQSEANLQQTLAAAATGVWSLDLASNAVHADARAQEIFGVGPGLPFALLEAALHPDDMPDVRRALGTAQREHTSFDIEPRLLQADGTVRHVAATGRFEYDATTGKPRYLRGLVRDTTARHRAAAELNYKERLLRNLLRNVPVLLARIGPDGRLREHVGPPLRRMGLADNELVGRLAVEEFAEDAAHIQRLLAGEPVNYTTRLARNGQLIYLQLFGFYDPEQQECIMFGSDVTETEHLKEEATRQRLRQQQELHAVILTTQEEERRRIAESLHNGVGQLLYATRLHLDTLPPSEGRRTSQELLNEAIRAIRTVSFELTPPVLQDFGLPAALRELLKRIPTSHLAIDLHLTGLELPLPATFQTAVYRIVQELLNNVIKHAQAQEVFISLVREAGQLYLSVEDDGQGLAPDSLEATTGIGLVGIRTRVDLLGGTFEVKSRTGKGTGIFLQLPVA